MKYKQPGYIVKSDLRASFNIEIGYRNSLSLFSSNHEFGIDLLGNRELFHPKITDHPSILWPLQKMEAKN